MSITNIIITSTDTAAMILDQLDPQDGASSQDSLQRTARYIGGLADGAFYYNTVVEQVGAVQAYGLVTFTGRPTADQTMVVLNTTLTAKDSGANGTTQFNTSGSDVAVTAANLAACINANTTLNKQVVATSAAGVVTITCLVAGLFGNGLQLSEGMDNTAITAFAHGTDGTSTTLS